jgi:hypothetical protein
VSDKVFCSSLLFLGSLACRTADISGILTVPGMISSIKDLPHRQRPEPKYQQYLKAERPLFGTYAFQIWALVPAAHSYTEAFSFFYPFITNLSRDRRCRLVKPCLLPSPSGLCFVSYQLWGPPRQCPRTHAVPSVYIGPPTGTKHHNRHIR